MDVYYFPIDKIEKSSNVIIYGNGLVGKQLVEWNSKFNCNYSEPPLFKDEIRVT